jgi:hypothetical protein
MAGKVFTVKSEGKLYEAVFPSDLSGYNTQFISEERAWAYVLEIYSSVEDKSKYLFDNSYFKNKFEDWIWENKKQFDLSDIRKKEHMFILFEDMYNEIEVNCAWKGYCGGLGIPYVFYDKE